jgi:hypothetical protein
MALRLHIPLPPRDNPKPGAWNQLVSYVPSGSRVAPSRERQRLEIDLIDLLEGFGARRRRPIS